MSTFDHSTLIQNISQQMGALRKAQPEAMQGFGQLAKSAMASGALSEKKQGADRAGDRHHAALLGLHRFPCQGPASPRRDAPGARGNARRLRLYGRRSGADVCLGSARRLGRFRAGHGISRSEARSRRTAREPRPAPPAAAFSSTHSADRHPASRRRCAAAPRRGSPGRCRRGIAAWSRRDPCALRHHCHPRPAASGFPTRAGGRRAPAG